MVAAATLQFAGEGDEDEDNNDPMSTAFKYRISDLPKQCLRNCQQGSGPVAHTDSLLDVIKKKHEEKGSEGSVNLDIRWRQPYRKMVLEKLQCCSSKSLLSFI